VQHHRPPVVVVAAFDRIKQELKMPEGIKSNIKKENQTHLPTLEEFNNLKLEVMRLRAVIENTPGHLYWKDLRGVYLGCNKNLKNILGDVENKTVYELVELDEAKRLEKVDNTVMTSGQEYLLEERSEIDGNPRIFLTRKKTMLDYNGNIVGLIGLSMDITDTKKTEILENEQRMTRKQMTVMKAIASSMSHDIRNVLAGINLGLGQLSGFFSYWLQRELNGEDADNIKKQRSLIGRLISRIKSAVNFLEIQLKNISTDTIDISKFKLLKMSDCIQEAIDSFAWENEALQKCVKVSIDNDFMFMGDLILTKHILFNLFSNSVHYIKEEGRGDINILVTQENDQPTLYYRDTAKGIAEEEAPKIFDRFYSDRTDGTGLGLAFCKTVVLAYGGYLNCTGQQDEFIEFKIQLPRVS
jgi:PAS domain S-box-containing protein